MDTGGHDLIAIGFSVFELSESGAIVGVQEVLVVVVLVQEFLAGLRGVEEGSVQSHPDLLEGASLVPADLDPATNPALDLSLVSATIDRRPDARDAESIDLAQVVEDVRLGELEIASEDGREWVPAVGGAWPD